MSKILQFRFERKLVLPVGETAEHIVLASDRSAAWRGVVKDISIDSLLNTESLTIVKIEE